MDGPEGTPVAAYAAALRKATDGYFESGADVTSAPAGVVAAGGTQGAMAEAMGISPSVLSRWLSGKRVAPLAGLHAIKVFLETRSFIVSDELWSELDELCGRALFHDGAPAATADRLAYLEAKLPGVLAAHQRAAARAQRAEDTCQSLQKEITEQRQSLLAARCYIRNMEADAAEQKKQGELLRTELKVLRKQKARLLEERPARPARYARPSAPYSVYPLAYARSATRLGTTLLAPRLPRGQPGGTGIRMPLRPGTGNRFRSLARPGTGDTRPRVAALAKATST
ncbi:helix-turn-helix domain-containing protein [Streptomyces erythrochromogenes]|uniref:helix-turn-helix domain-containing protein n=1 Tax=Streptomyces erythrochromogenes TaxID=285574 RepID=UPI0037D07971